MRTLVRDGTHAAFATHDPPMVDACRAYAEGLEAREPQGRPNQPPRDRDVLDT